MKIVIIGSGTSVIRENQKGSSFLLDLNDQLLLFDCGWGSPENLLRAGFDIQKIDHIFISHPHADHIGSLINIVQSIYVSGLFFPLTKRTKPLNLHGYEGFSKDYETLRSIMFSERVEDYEIKVTDHINDTVKFDGFVLKTTEVRHNQKYFHSNAYRVEAGGKSFVYSGDMGYDEKFIALSKDADIALLEMSFWPAFYKEFGPRSNHISSYECGLIAKQANIKKLVIVHHYRKEPDEKVLEEIRKEFKGEVIISKDLQEITI